MHKKKLTYIHVLVLLILIAIGMRAGFVLFQQPFHDQYEQSEHGLLPALNITENLPPRFSEVPLLSSPYVSQYLNSQYISPAINNYLQTLNSPTLQTLEQAYANILQQQRNQAQQTGGYPTGIPGYTLSNNPNYWLASFAAFPGTLQNVAADANQALGRIYSYFTGNPYTQYIPFNPMGNILNPSLNQVAPYLQAFANQYGQDILPAPFPPWLGQDIVKGAFTNPISFITNAASGISNQQTPTLQSFHRQHLNIPCQN